MVEEDEVGWKKWLIPANAQRYSKTASWIGIMSGVSWE